MVRRIDIRIMNLNKWYVPKSFSLDKLKEPVVLGYFDAFEVRELQVDPERFHPFNAGYKELEAWKNNEKKELVDYSSQGQMLFLNIDDEEKEDGTCFAQQTVDGFWEDKTYPYIFLSMIHINHSGKLSRALKRINNVFKKDYLSYISFDYCDIVLFTHNTRIDDFLSKIKLLFEVKQEAEAVIFDTFSMVSFSPSFVQNQEYLKCKRIYEKEGLAEFQATINLSIRDYQQFKEWYSEVKGWGYGIARYNMLGRHDISIINEHANTVWLMRIMKKLHEDKSKEIFWTFETYIKILDKDEINMTSSEPDFLNSVYSNVKDNLNEEIKGLKAVIDHSGFRDKDRYLLPIYEVRDCICSIVKNNFAEEFVYCIYESFFNFVLYMKKEIKKLNDMAKDRLVSENEIANGYDKYFTALNTLVNSTMHSERQFVQATAFNAVFYSVPPKIMAFYNAYIHRIKRILRDMGRIEQYTFLIYPSFSSTIFVERISLEDTTLDDRILTVRISEKSLYDMESVMYQMVHELAHYVGHRLRCRRIRKLKIMDTLLRHIVDKCRMDHATYQMLLSFVDKKMICDAEKNEDPDSYRFDYLEHIEEEGKRLLVMLQSPRICKAFMEEYYKQKVNVDKQFRDDTLTDLGIELINQKNYVMNLLPQYCDVKYEMILEKLKKLDCSEEMKEYEDYIYLLRSVYSECYADLQMILVLAMDAEDYLSTFWVKQNVSVEEILLDTESMVRICTVYRVMTDSTIWDKKTHCDGGRFRMIISLIDGYNNEVIKETSAERYSESQKSISQIIQLLKKYDFDNGIRLRGNAAEALEPIELKQEKIVPYVDTAIGLYEYLLEAVKKSLEEYTLPNKQEAIRQVRTMIKNVLLFEDTVQVFDCIEKELNYYKQEGCRI